MDKEVSILWQLNGAAQHCVDQDVAAMLRGYAVLIGELMVEVERKRTLKSIIDLNGACARAHVAWEKAQMPPDNPPRAGAIKEALAA